MPARDANTLDSLYNLMKKITGKKIKKIKAKELEKWMLKTEKFVEHMEKLVKKAKTRKKKK